MRIVRRIVAVWLALIAVAGAAALAVRRLVPAFGGESDDAFSLVYAMSGGEFTSSAKELRSGEITAFMGGAKVDLRNAGILDGANLTLRACMGGIDIVVPATWRVEVASSVFMGGVSNLTDPDAVGDSAPLLIIAATVVMGGVEIHADPAAAGVT